MNRASERARDAVARAVASQETIVGLILVAGVVRAARDELGAAHPELGDADALEAIHAALFAANEAGTIELRPDAGNAFTPADLALCPRGWRGVYLPILRPIAPSEPS